MKLSDLLKTIEVSIPNLGGWATPEKCCEFAATVIALHPHVTVELGTWMGRGAFSLAMAHKFIGYGKVHVVDPWSALASVDGMTGADAQWWGDQAKHELAFDQFNKTKTMLQLDAWIEVQRTSSELASIPEGIGFLIIDGNHGPQAVNDVARWGHHVIVGGVVYLDDLNWSGGAVAQAGKDLMALGFVPLYKRDEGMFYQRTR